MSSGIRFKDGKILFRGTYGTSIGFGDGCCCGCTNTLTYPIRVYRSGGITFSKAGTERYASVEAVARDSASTNSGKGNLCYSANKAYQDLTYQGGYVEPTYSGCELVKIDEFAAGDPDDKTIEVSYGTYPAIATISVKKSDCLNPCATCEGGKNESDPYDNWCNCDGTFGP